MVTGTSVADVNVAGIVVAWPSMVVTTPVVNVRTEWETVVMGVVMDEVSMALDCDVPESEDVGAGVDESEGLVAGGDLVEVVGMTMGVEDVVIESVEFPANCRLCASRRA
jgi:hypothetical protein